MPWKQQSGLSNEELYSGAQVHHGLNESDLILWAPAILQLWQGGRPLATGSRVKNGHHRCCPLTFHLLMLLGNRLL